MKALVKLKRGPGNVELIDRPEPELADNEVMIRVKSAGICGTDVKIWDELTWSNPPVTLGHEFSGVVERVGSAVRDFKPGDRVLSETPQVVCGKCEFCKTGHFMMCKGRLSIGYGVDGAFAELIKVREAIVHKLPDGLDFNTAALCEPLAVAVHAVYDNVEILPTHTVGVMGPGPIGQLVAQVVQARGAKTVVLGTGCDGERLALASRLGADAVLVTTEDDFAEKAAKAAPNGFDIVFDCSGAQPAINAGLGLLRNMGTLVQVGLTKPQVMLDYGQFPSRELRLFGSFGHRPANWDQALTLLVEGKIHVDGIIAKDYELEDWEQAFNDMKAQKGIKLMLHPNGMPEKE
ncbi:MAG: zinc-dependent alcohol dehydrogenase [Agathobaculum sp.]|uniref:zinc-dependent alcohol dehydrogenase n=1 Tax=Agathobaculum sp. TaxID=2048138 RepID=UPI003D8B2CCC